MTCSRQARFDVTVNAVSLVADFIIPSLMQVAGSCPQICFRYRPSMAVVPVSAGRGGGSEPIAISLRGGGEPAADGVSVRRLGLLTVGLYATGDYIARHGLVEGAGDLSRHVLVHHDEDHDNAPWERWLTAHAPGTPIILRSNDEAVQRAAVRSGHCAAFMPISSLLWNPHLRAVMAPLPDWAAPLWMVTPSCESLPPQVCEAVEMLGALLARCLLR